jgi:hypothetical protein
MVRPRQQGRLALQQHAEQIHHVARQHPGGDFGHAGGSCQRIERQPRQQGQQPGCQQRAEEQQQQHLPVGQGAPQTDHKRRP